MKLFKRNQVEEAIGAVLNPNSAVSPRTLQTQIKRLLETDRALKDEEDARPEGRKCYAFYREKPPGSGTEIWFSDYEAFAVAVGLCLMSHQWPQSFVVAVLQEIRPDLEREYSRILSSDRARLLAKDAANKWAEQGQMPFNNSDPVLVTIVSMRWLKKSEQSTPYFCAVKRGPVEALKFVNELQPIVDAAWSFLDVTPTAIQISDALARTKPRVRGRG